MLCVLAVLVAAALASGPECEHLTESSLETVPDAGDASKTKLFCIDIGDDTATMLVIYEGQHSDEYARIEVNNRSDTCNECADCISTYDPNCQGTVCACNMRCLQGTCSQTIAPVTNGRYYIRVLAEPPYAIRVRLFPAREITPGIIEEGSLASVEPYLSGTRVQEATPWWAYYYVIAPTTGLFTVTVKNLEDSGIRRGYVKVAMRVGQYPDLDHSDAVFSTYTHDSVEAHLKHVEQGQKVFIGVVGMGGERWIRYQIRTGGYKFGAMYAVLGVGCLLLLLGVFVWYHKQRVVVQQRARQFHSRAYAIEDKF